MWLHTKRSDRMAQREEGHSASRAKRKNPLWGTETELFVGYRILAGYQFKVSERASEGCSRFPRGMGYWTKGAEEIAFGGVPTGQSLLDVLGHSSLPRTFSVFFPAPGKGTFCAKKLQIRRQRTSWDARAKRGRTGVNFTRTV